ncbi:MAG: glycosyltransferase family 2 protein, partial [Mobilitalea sp.]
MIDNPLVSIIVPMFNAEKVVSVTIRSVQAQTYNNWEMIVCDNCSTDNSRNIIEDFILQDKRIRLIKSDYNSGGPARPRNTGIRNANGKYLAFLDTDDIWIPEKLEKEVNFLNENSEFFLVYSKCFVREDGVVSRISPRKVYSGDVFNRLYLEFNFIPCMTVMMLNQKGQDQYFFSEDKKFVCIEDYILWLTIARKHKIGAIDESLATYV